MRYGIFSDVHSNLVALEAVLGAYRTERIDRYVCAGDIIGYATSPKECIATVRELNPILIAGNHDWASVDLFSTSYFNPIAKEAVEWTRQQMGTEEERFLRTLNLTFTNDDFVMVHGTLD